MSKITFDSYFESDKTQEYNLYIHVSLYGFSFSVVNISEKRLLAYNATSLKISNETFLVRRFNEWVKSENLFQKEFKKVTIIFDTEKYTIVPEDYYDCNLKSEIINLLFETTGEFETEEIKIAELNARLLFCVPSGLKNVFEIHFKNFEFIHPVKTLAENLPENNKEHKLIAYFSKNCFYALLFNKANLLLSNSFTILHENDPVFYILSMLKQTKVAKQTVDLFAAGNITIGSRLYTDLKKHIPSVQVLAHKEPLKIDKDVFSELGINGLSFLSC